MRQAVAVLAFVAAAALAADARYQLDLGSSLGAGGLELDPVVSGPAGKRLRYEIEVRREGAGNSADNRQSGSVVLDADGKGRLASSAVSVGRGDSWLVNVRVFDGARLVAEERLKGP